MDIGSVEHQKLLYKMVWKMLLKTSAIAIVVGLVFMLPSLIRENTFSLTMLMLGKVIIVVGVGYALWVGWKKHRAIQKALKAV